MTKPLRVLLVEDSEDDAVLLQEALRAGGFNPHARRVETEAEFRAALAGETWDLVIADYVLPRFSGVAAIRLARETSPDLPIIMVSGKTGEETAVEAMRAGADDYILKGNLSRLVPAVERELRDTVIRRERRLAEEALRDALYRAQQYLDIAGVMLLGLDQDGRVTLINRKGLEILGCASDAVVGKIWIDEFVPATAREKVRDTFRRLMAGEQEHAEYVENPVQRCTGEERLLAFHNALLRDDDGRILGTLSSGEDVTERKQVEGELRLLSSALEAAANGVVITGIDGTIIWVNQAVAWLTGYRRDELIGQNTHIFRSGKQPREFYREMWSTIREGKVWHGQLVNRRKDGSLYTEEMTITPVRAEGGEITHFIAIKEDVTERIRTEEALRKSEERFRELADAMPQLVWTAEPDGRVDYYNMRYREYAETTSTGEGSDHWGLILHPDDQASTEAAWRHAVATGKKYQIEHRIRMADGSYRWHLSRGVPVRDDTGRIAKWYGTATDINDLKVAQEERELLLEEVGRRAAELDSTLNAIADGLLFYGPDQRVLRANATAEKIFGLTRDQLPDTLAERLRLLRIEKVDGQPFALEDTPAWRALHGETVHDVIEVLHTPDGRTKWISGSAAPVYTPDGTLIGAVATFSDITRLHDLQEQREVYIHTISHDLRAPLAVIQGYADLLRETLQQQQLDGMLQSSVESIRRGAMRMNVMIQDLVDTARMEGGQLALELNPVNLRSYLDDYLRRIAVTMEVDRVRVEVPDDLPPVCADSNRLERIFSNLLSNALKYSDPGTPVQISARPVDSVVQVAVTDHGRGIAPADLPHLFERFYRGGTGRKAEGIGLGLYITRMLVEAHGSGIWVESEPDVGSTFYFTLPVAR